MSLIAYPIILFVFVILIWIFGKVKHENATIADPAEVSQYKWSVVIKSKGKLYKGIEDNDLGKVGYYIYQNFATKLDQVDVYVKDNQNNEILMIQKTYESECMIGVDHPEKGHIGYLPFENVERI
jgi:hypothetical protein